MSNFLYLIGLLFLIGVLGTLVVFVGFKIYEYHGAFPAFMYSAFGVYVVITEWKSHRDTGS